MLFIASGSRKFTTLRVIYICVNLIWLQNPPKLQSRCTSLRKFNNSLPMFPIDLRNALTLIRIQTRVRIRLDKLMIWFAILSQPINLESRFAGQVTRYQTSCKTAWMPENTSWEHFEIHWVYTKSRWIKVIEFEAITFFQSFFQNLSCTRNQLGRLVCYIILHLVYLDQSFCGYRLFSESPNK